MPSRIQQAELFIAPVLLCSVLGFTSRIAAVEIPEADRKQAQDTVKALGSNSYSERLNARNQLMQLGRASIEPLEYATKSEDPEVRLRAIEILIALRGRGFLGIGLQESTDDELVDEEPAEEKGKPASTVAPPVVIANQIVSSKQPPYNSYGITKQFPAEAAGMQPGDKILSINDRPLHGTKDLMREVITLGPARKAIVLIERGGERMKVPVLLTRNPIVMRGNEFGGYQWNRDESPPIDLEREMDGLPPDKRADAHAPRAGAQAQLGGRGQIFIQGGAKIVVEQIGGDPNAPPPKIQVQVQVDGGNVKKIDVNPPEKN